MSGVEAGFRVRMQDAGSWYPPFEDRSKLLPLLPRGLTAANQNVPPEPIDAILEDAQLIDVAGNSMVLVVAGDDLAKPYTNLTSAIMLPALKLSLDGFKLRDHSQFRCNSPDGERLCLVTTPAVVGEAQEREGLRFTIAALLPVTGRIAPELDQPGLIRVEFQAELRQPYLELSKEPHGISPLLKAHHKIVGVTDDDDIALCHFPAPAISPQIEHVVEIHVGDQR